MSASDNRYQCTICKRVRSVKVDVTLHGLRIKDSPNGLVVYSDVHRCDEGFLGINNVYLDVNCNIRSFENLQLPKKRKPLNALKGLPMPKSKKTDDENTMRVYKITKIIKDRNIRIRIVDQRLLATIEIGDMVRGEKMVALIESDLGTVYLEYFPSDVYLNEGLEKWLTLMVNLLEKLPPTTLGLFIESILYIYSNYFQAPDAFLVKQLKTIIVSHETYFSLKIPESEIKEKVQYVGIKYGDDVKDLMDNALSYLMANPSYPLRYYSRTHHEDLVYLINLFLILEQEGVIVIQRPGMMEEKIDLELGLD